MSVYLASEMCLTGTDDTAVYSVSIYEAKLQ